MKWFWCPFNRTLSIISIFCAPGLWLSSSRWRLFAIATSLLYVPSKLRRGGSEWLSAVFPHMATYPHSPSTLYISFLLSFLCINIITKFFIKVKYFLLSKMLYYFIKIVFYSFLGIDRRIFKNFKTVSYKLKFTNTLNNYQMNFGKINSILY